MPCLQHQPWNPLSGNGWPRPIPRRTALRTSLPADLRQAKLDDLPPNVSLSTGRLEITAPTALEMLESLFTLALVMQNDLE